MRRPPRSTLFPSTTLFRSAALRRTLTTMRMARAGRIGVPPVRRRASVETERRALLAAPARSEEHTSELQSRQYLVCRLLLEKKLTYSRRCYHTCGLSAPLD